MSSPLQHAAHAHRRDKTMAFPTDECASFSYGHRYVVPSQLSLGGPPMATCSTKGAAASTPVSQTDASSSIDGALSSYSTASSSAERPMHHGSRSKAAIPRPPNAWILYRSAKLKERTKEEWKVEHGWQRYLAAPLNVSQSGPSSAPASISTAKTTPDCSLQCFVSRRIAEMWNAEQEDVRARFYQLAHEKKEQHTQLFPSYQFRPRRGAKEREEQATESKGTPEGEVVAEKSSQKGNYDHSGQAKGAAYKATTVVSSSADTDKPEQDKDTAKATGTVARRKRPATTAKTKAKGPPKLFIDVNVAENQATSDPPFLGDKAWSEVVRMLQAEPFSGEQDRELTANGSPSGTQVLDSSVTIDTLMRDEKNMNGCLSTGQLPSSTQWTVSPFSITPIEADSVERGNKVETKRKRATRRKSTSSIGRKAQSDGPTVTCGKKARRSVAKRALTGEQKSSECGQRSAPNNDSAGPSEAKAPKRGKTVSKATEQLETLRRSYDRQGLDSEVEEALLCADTLIESFESMPAWVPNESWQSALENKRIGDMTQSKSAPAVPLQSNTSGYGGDVPTSWLLYTHPVDPFASTLAQYQWPVAAAPLNTQDDERVVEHLQEELDRMDEGPLLPQIVSPGRPDALSGKEAVSEEAVAQAAWSLLAQLDTSPNQAEQGNGWSDAQVDTPIEQRALSEEAWDKLLTSAIVPPCNAAREIQAGLEPYPESVESVWDLVRFDTPSAPAPTVTPLIRSPGQTETHMVELHGSFTEEDLLEKLVGMQKARARQKTDMVKQLASSTSSLS